MNFYAVSALVNLITSTTLGILVLLSNPRARTNITFFLFAFAVGFWSLAYVQWQLASDAVGALFWTHLLMAGSIFIPPFYFHFVVNFLDRAKKLRPVIIIGYAQALIFSVINWTPLFITSVSPKLQFPFWPNAGILFLPFLLIWGFYALLPVVMLFLRMRITTSGTELNQIRYILVGTLIGYAGGETNHFLWYNIPIPPFGTISASIYIAFVAAAIVRYRFFNIKMIVTEVLTFSLWLFIFLRMVFSQTYQEQWADAGLLIVTLIIGALLIRSVDQEVEARETIEKQEKELEASNERQENLIHFLSHEVKGYLAHSEAGFAAIAEGDYGPISPDLKSLAQRALQETRNGVDTVMDILSAGNFKKGTVSYAMEPFDLREVVTKAVEEAKPAAAEKKLDLRLDIAGAGNYRVVGDATQIGKHVIHNLLDNSVKYTPQGSVTVSLSRQGSRILFSVADTGVGITPEDKARLFTEGGRGKDSLKVNAHSTGYGLFIARSITEAHHGRIWADSQGPGKGSTFFVELPAQN